MSAIDTAQMVIEWAGARGPLAGAPPQGDLRQAEQLAKPPDPLRQALGALTALTTARLRFGTPPLGDESAVSTDAMLIAAAIGSAGLPRLARVILGAVPAQAAPIDMVARHGLIAPALRFLPLEVAEECRAISPLTALLDWPLPEQEALCIELARRLLAHPAERLSLTLHLAQPVADAQVRRWRQTLLERLRLGGDAERSFVLDVYEAQMIHHIQDALEQVREARAAIGAAIDARDEAKLRDAGSVAAWWGVLWRLERADLQAVRNRPYLGYEYRAGLALFRLYQKLTGGA